MLMFGHPFACSQPNANAQLSSTLAVTAPNDGGNWAPTKNNHRDDNDPTWLQQRASRQNQRPMPTETPTATTTQTADDGIQSTDESTSDRNELATYLFLEFYNKNLSASLDTNSPAQVVPVAIHPSSNEPVQFAGSAGASSSGPFHGGHLAGVAGSGTMMMAGSGVSQSIANTANGSHAAAAAAAAANDVVPIHATATTANGRPYFGDAFYSFQVVYWPIHCVICLAICTLGIFANVTNIIVLTRPNMITAVNTILSAMALTDLIVNVSNIPYLMHELSNSTDYTSFYSFPWAVYILFHAHTTVTAHTISIWLTCVLATWRYFVVCRAQASSQRNWSVGLAKRVIVGVFLFVPIFCIPNYLSFAILTEVTQTNSTIYKVGFSHLADESDFIKTFHFWIFSCLTKLVPCVLLTFFTTVLIRKLLNARERRLRLATYGSGNGNEHELDKLPNGDTSKAVAATADRQPKTSPTNRPNSRQTEWLTNGASPRVEAHHFRHSNGANHFDPDGRQQEQRPPIGAHTNNQFKSIINQANDSAGQPDGQQTTAGQRRDNANGNANESETGNTNPGAKTRVQLAYHSGSSCGCNTEAEILATSCTSSLSAGANNTGNGLDSSPGTATTEAYDLLTPTISCGHHSGQTGATSGAGKQRPKIMSQLIVESSGYPNNGTHGTTTSISLTSAPTKLLASCGVADTPGTPTTTAAARAIQQQLDDGSQVTESSAIHIGSGCLKSDQQLQNRPASSCGATGFYRSAGLDAETTSNNIVIRPSATNNKRPLMNSDNQHLSFAAAEQSQRQLAAKGNSVSHADLAMHAVDAEAGCGLVSSMKQANNRRSLAAPSPSSCKLQVASQDRLSEKRASETILGNNNVRGRSIGSTTLAPFQIVKLQAAQRQLNQNETTTRLLIAVMIVFLICEFPAGILAALCAILGQDFFENVYQPTGILTDLLALINSSVNFILYCFMSTQFRITFYRVVLHCPAPNVPAHNEQYEANKEARKQSARKATLQ